MKNVVCRRRAFSVFIYKTAKKVVRQLGRYGSIAYKLVTKERSGIKNTNA